MRLTNPVCEKPGYTATMSELLPAVVWLDREVVATGVTGSGFYKDCQDILRKSEECEEHHVILNSGIL